MLFKCPASGSTFAALGQHQPKQSLRRSVRRGSWIHTDERKTPAARCIRVGVVMTGMPCSYSSSMHCGESPARLFGAIASPCTPCETSSSMCSSTISVSRPRFSRMISSTPEGGKLLCGALHACTHDLHRRRLGGLQNRTQLELPADFDQRPSDQIRFINLLILLQFCESLAATSDLYAHRLV